MGEKKRRKIHISRRKLKKAAFVGLILALIVVMVYSGLQIVETTRLRNATDADQRFVSKTIIRDGEEYFPRQDMTVFLLMGIDQYGKVADSGSYNNKGAADMVLLAVFDETAETYSVIQINRDTMAEMPVIGIDGKQAGTYYGQLALSHTYGSGLKDSCENTRKAVSDLLYGLHIDYYVAMHMDAITVLNDAVGGVSVNVTEDFSKVDPTIGMGEVTLMGEQAISYVRTRKDVGDQLNLSRMDRQKEYIKGFLTALKEKHKTEKRFFANVYEDVEDYLVSNLPINSLSSMVERYDDYALGQITSLEGRNVMGEKYMEFYVDEAGLDELVLQLFYAPKES